ncbi:type II toxin-antitoxin system VapC family toxin [Mucilaginibacter pallidiroseus]|uniref:Type II toxin-antitoxin system VapC family toxin n=1 Tax=Mucilaginibacter pallidiroseus TaxID=2599295 RepID=A0A563UE79_9SPHI|nr:type II toxin-antitoxin system VapC family toxin [Mucilaginibacter pallidiroseus]TWR29660.1 type II toxin-antitoxin system VapC family toxin [Mucilaginibacter pallidiroseus]
MILCDTNILIHLFNGDKSTFSTLTNFGFDNVAISAVTVMELYQGMGNKAELQNMKKKIRFYDIIEIDSESSALATDLIEKFRLSHNLQIPDAIIGASAIIHQIPLFTYNKKDFSFMPGLQLA